MTAFANYPIDKIQQHPNNVRRVAVADDAMVDSIRSAGILEPVVLGPDTGDGLRYLITGNRRWDGAMKAALTQMPAVLRDDLVTEAQQIEAMLVENLHRSDLTVMEEADAYEQLQLFGMDTDAIALATGRAKSTIKSRLKLTALTTNAQDKLHDGQITIGDAEALLEFADDHEIYAELERNLGTSDFTWKVNSAREIVKRAARNAEVVAGFEELGAVEVDHTGERTWSTLGRFWDSALQDPSAHTHTECLGYVDYGTASYSAPSLVCMNPDLHAEQEEAHRATVGAGGTSSAAGDEQRAEWERQRVAREAAAEARRVSEQTRVEWLAQHWLSCLPSKGKQATQLVAAARAFLPALLATGTLDDVVSTSALDHALGLEHEDSWARRDPRNQGYATSLQTASAGEVLKALAGVLATFTEEALSYAATVESEYPGELETISDAWTWFEGAGYPLSTADSEIRDQILAAADDDSDGDD